MASSSASALNQELQCSICLEVFTDPVTTPCGHNFCRTCLSECWTNTQTCFCPLCKERFSKRPDLKINTTLREVVQHFEKLNLGESKVFCDICDERKQKAVKSCLTCQISYCDSHLEPHLRVPRLKKHTLINAVENLEDYICQKHERPLEMFCRDDQTRVCDSDVNVNSLYSALSLLKKTLDGTLNKKLSQTGLKFVQKYAVDVTLDPDTANPYLILSYDGKQVSHGDIKQNVPKNPKRLADRSVLAKQGFSSGRFYYEVQVKGKTEWGLGVARESINRKGEIAAKPKYGVWILMLMNENQYIACDDPYVSLSLRVKPEKVGVFVDYEEGLVSFYDVGSGSHIYSFTGQTFTEKLYPGFDPCLNDKGKNSKPLIITPVS